MKLAPGVGPARGILNALTQVRVHSIAVGLQQTPKPLEELLRPLSGSTHPKVKNHWPIRPTELHEYHPVMVCPQVRPDFGNRPGFRRPGYICR